MSEIAIIGYASIAAAFLVTVVTGISAVIGAVSDSARFRTAAEYGSYLICTLFGVASAAAQDPRNIRNGTVLPDEGYCDQPYAVRTADDAWLCVMTTGSGRSTTT